MDSKRKQFELYEKRVFLLYNIHLSKHQECKKGNSQIIIILADIGKSVIFHLNEENKPTGNLKFILS